MYIQHAHKKVPGVISFSNSSFSIVNLLGFKKLYFLKKNYFGKIKKHGVIFPVLPCFTSHLHSVKLLIRDIHEFMILKRQLCKAEFIIIDGGVLIE